MDRFLDASAFGGAGDTFPPRPMRFAGQARFDGVVLFVNWPRAGVAAVLPEGIELARNVPCPDWHPVVFIIGRQREGALVFAGLSVPTGIGYEEVGIAIPFVRHGGDPRLHIYVPRMYSSFFPAVWSGNIYYGFGKEHATIGQEGQALVARAEDGAPLIRTEVGATGAWLAGPGCTLVNFDAMRAVLGLPVVARHASGRWVCSRFDWGFGDARVRPVGGSLSIESPLGQGLAPGRWTIVPDGGFEVQGMFWRLTWPTPCR